MTSPLSCAIIYYKVEGPECGEGVYRGPGRTPGCGHERVHRKATDMALLQVEVVGVGIDPKSHAFFVALKDKQDTVLPILIGYFEAQSISAKLLGADPPRPGAYDTIKAILDATRTRVVRVVVNALSQDTFFARITLEGDGTTFSLDCRPSDAIAIALRCEAPVFVEAHVMDAAGGPLKLLAKHEPDSSVPKGGPAPELTELEGLKLKLKQLVDREDYEGAAAVRDRILELERGDA